MSKDFVLENIAGYIKVIHKTKKIAVNLHDLPIYIRGCTKMRIAKIAKNVGISASEVVRYILEEILERDNPDFFLRGNIDDSIDEIVRS